MKKIILMAGLLAMGSMYVAADEQPDLKLTMFKDIHAAKAWPQSLEARSLAVLTDEDFNKLPEYTRMQLSNKLKDVYFAHPKNIEAWPKGLHRFLQLSVQDLIDYNRVPAFENKYGKLTLDLEDKNLKSLEGLQNIPGIETVRMLWLMGNQLSELPENIFNGLTALQDLWLHGNQLTTLPVGIFNDLTALKWLTLSGNQLTTLPVNIFNGLTELRLLALPDNKLRTLPENIFNGLTALQWLSLPDNELSELPENTFNGLTALGSLFLGNNQLTDEQVRAIRAALQGRDIYLEIDNQRPPVEDESALAGSSTGSEMADDQRPPVEDESALAGSSTGSEMSARGQKRTLDEREDQKADEVRNNNGKRKRN